MIKKISLFLIFVTYLLSMSCANNGKKADSPTGNNASVEQGNTPSVSDNQNEPSQGKKGKKYKGNRNSDDNKTPPNVANNNIPPKVFKVLDYIKKNGESMDGYVGGRNFQNRERQLDIKDATGKKIKYQEWDVNPKIQGKNRGTERIITGSDNRAWYTNDHYQSFVEIK